MKFSRILLPLAFLMLPLTACKDQELRGRLDVYFNGSATEDGLYEWQQKVWVAICNLERTFGDQLIQADRMCPNPPVGGGGDPTGAPPPPPEMNGDD